MTYLQSFSLPTANMVLEEASLAFYQLKMRAPFDLYPASSART